jgi:hypothetical protein
MPKQGGTTCFSFAKGVRGITEEDKYEVILEGYYSIPVQAEA